ncbi:MAG TPA: creatininase family protein [Bryobacteraceae bacterium]|jgi:creatinine amidohydrolase/Fe(II)-dependent formamide hydrolase-like protein|nr:creatininase family protein [Bryobacteraceae bacterium]
MRFLITIVSLIVLFAPAGRAQNPPATPNDLVDFEMMTWPEVKAAIHQQGKTTALVYNGGTEQRGPQAVNGGHTLMARATVHAIALKLGNAIAAPVMPFSPNNASAELPGTIGLTPELFAAVNEQVAEQLIRDGFKSVVLMGDHGGGQNELRAVAARLQRKYAGKGIRVVFCGDVYRKANDDFDKWCAEHGYSFGGHANIPDTSEMIYLGADKRWVRMNLLPGALGDPEPAPGKPAVHKINNEITGDARRSSAELGKRLFDMKVDYAVNEIHRLLK